MLRFEYNTPILTTIYHDREKVGALIYYGGLWRFDSDGSILYTIRDLKQITETIEKLGTAPNDFSAKIKPGKMVEITCTRRGHYYKGETGTVTDELTVKITRGSIDLFINPPPPHIRVI